MTLPNGTKRRRYTLELINTELNGGKILLQKHRTHKVSLSVPDKSRRGGFRMICQWPYGTEDALLGAWRVIELEQAMKLVERNFP